MALVTALGPGSGCFAGVQHHTSAFDHLTRMLGVSHSNPRMSPQEARRFACAREVSFV